MVQVDEKGLVVLCPNCRQRNRLAFGQLQKSVRCGKCGTNIPPTHQPVQISNEKEFDVLTRGSSLPVLVDFWAAWCGPCKMVAPELEKVAARQAGALIVAKVNTEDLPNLAARYAVSSIPLLILFRQGQETARTAGARPAAGIEKFVAETVSAA